jgi:hypothetical protein
MEILFELFKSFWYLWILFVFASLASLFAPKIKGYFGEKSVAFFLSGLDESKYKIINNIMLQVGNKTTQIDYVVVSNYGIFVIETKNYKGWILGNEFDDYWTQKIYKSNHRLRNPIKQNYGHIQALKEHLSEFNDVNYISIVTFTTNADLKIKTKSEVVYTVKLSKTIKKYNTETISNTIKEQIYSKLLSSNVDSKENRQEHVKAIHNDIADRDNKLKNNVCPKCNGELVMRKGKHGNFKGCSNYPKCRFIAK